MSISLLYHGFGIVGYRYTHTRYENGTIIFRIAHDKFSHKCSNCNSDQVVCRGRTMRRFRAIPIGTKPVFIEIEIQRVFCWVCQVVRQVKLAFAKWRRSYTKAFVRYALELSRVMTISDVAKHLGVSWGTIKEIQKEYLLKRYTHPSLKKLDLIAIDEINIGKGHRYLTVVLNLKTGAVIFVGEGKGAEALSPFFNRLKWSKAQVKAVAIDMSPAYIAAVIENLPNAAIVFDHFHVIKLFNEKLSEFRRALYNASEKTSDQKVLKGTRWLLLKNPENLNEQKDEHQRLANALKLNQPLATAYYLKEDLRQFWKQKSKAKAKEHLLHWVAKAESTKIPMLKKFAKTLRSHMFGLLTFYDYSISTGPLEGTNNKIKTLQKQAYGFRDLLFFKLKIYALHETKYALIG
jgi:transposase